MQWLPGMTDVHFSRLPYLSEFGLIDLLFCLSDRAPAKPA
jgi:hypothetical protein